MIKKIIILGTGGNCIDILDTILDINASVGDDIYDCVGFLDDNEGNWHKEFYGVPVLGALEMASGHHDCWFVNGIGSVNNFWKKRDIIARTGVSLDRFMTLIHPTASVSRTARVGYGTVIFQHVIVTSNVQIGNHVIVLPHAVISHDSVIGDYTCITGGVSVSGGVEIGRSCYLGTNAALKERIKVGDGSLIGMGSVVLDDVPENTAVAGNPARVIRQTIVQGQV